MIYRTLQVVYNANHLSKIVEKKEKCLNKIEYLQKQQATRQSSKRSTTRVSICRNILLEHFDSLRFSHDNPELCYHDHQITMNVHPNRSTCFYMHENSDADW